MPVLIRAAAAMSFSGRVLSLLLYFRRAVALALFGHRVFISLHFLSWTLLGLRGHVSQASSSFLFLSGILELAAPSCEALPVVVVVSWPEMLSL